MGDIKTYQLYTDGGCRGNPGKGGWGYHLITPDLIMEDYGFEKLTTNNQMELLAVIEGLDPIPKGSSVVVFTDSMYVKNGITIWIHNWIKNNWKTAGNKPVKNKSYWLGLHNASQEYNIEWQWVKGHSNVYGNERADLLANKAMDSYGKYDNVHPGNMHL